MNQRSETDATDRARGRVMTGVLVAGAVMTWVVAAMLVWLIAPQLSADPAIAHSPDSTPASVLAVASAVPGVVLFVGVELNWFAPRRALGRAILLIGLPVCLIGYRAARLSSTCG